MNELRSLTFRWTAFSLAISVVLILATAAFGFVAWRRSGWARGTGLLELLRLALVILVAITLNQPEWLKEQRSDQKPTLVILSDVSGSMQTQDVLDEAQPAIPPQTREQAIEPLLEEERWQSLQEKWKVVFQSFSSPSQDPNEGSDIGEALLDTLKQHENLCAVVLLSDGDWNLGEPPATAAAQLRVKNVPVYPVGVGSRHRLPDVEISRFDVPTFAAVGKPLRIPIVIDSALASDYAVTISLTPSSGESITKQVTIPAMHRLEDAFVWKPEETGEFELTVDIPASPDELATDNNRRTVPINIRQETIKVLLIESVPRWEYRYLRNALDRDPGVDVSCLLFHPGLSKSGGGKGYVSEFPQSLEELSKYDVVFLGDVGVGEDQLTAEQCRLIKGLVQSQASGLIFMPGILGRHASLLSTELADLYPVVLDEQQLRGWGSRSPAQFALTGAGRQSLLTKLEDNEDENARLWESLPGFHWYAAVKRAKAGTEILAIHESESTAAGPIPLLVTKTYGTGKILFMGTDGAWRWREGVEDKYHYRFWGQVARWMVYQRSMAQGKLMRLFYSPDRPRADDVMTLNANVMQASGEPLQEGTVFVQVVAPSGNIERVQLQATSDEWGLFTGQFTPGEHGDYKLTLVCRENNSSIETKLSVQGLARERVGEPARHDVLEEIAAISRGQMGDSADLDGLIAEISALPDPEPLIYRLRIWCHPLWAGSLVLLLGVFWVGRKLNGTV